MAGGRPKRSTPYDELGLWPWRSFFMAITMPLAAIAQAVPNWNVTLPAAPGTSTQKVTLTPATRWPSTSFAQQDARRVPLIRSLISKPYLYTNKNWLIDLNVKPKVNQVNTLTVVSHTDTTAVDQVSIQFLKEADAAAGRSYLMAHLK